MTDARSDFAEYVTARRTDMRRLAYLLCGDWHAADDIVQIALSKLYRAWPRIHRTSAEDAYVRRTIVRTSIDESRHPWRRERLVEPHPAGGERGEHVGVGVDVLRALRSLPSQQHKVVVLRFWLDLSVAQTADALGVSEGTVKSQTWKAMRSLRPLLLDETVERHQ